MWLSDITEDPTPQEGKLYLCAINDALSNRIVGYSIDSRMKSRLATTALASAVAWRGEVAGCIVHADRGSQPRGRKFVHALGRNDMVGSMGRVRAPGDNVAMESFFSLSQKSVRDQPLLANPRTAPDRNRHLDRTLLPPQTMTSRSQGGFTPIEFEAIITTPASQAA